MEDALIALAASNAIQGAYVDVLIDNKAVIAAWEAHGARDLKLNGVLKCIFELTLRLNFPLRMMYVASSVNPADRPSRKLSLNDTRRINTAWSVVESHGGPHSVDPMALDENARCRRFLSEFPSLASSGRNVFQQHGHLELNPYVFPPTPMVNTPDQSGGRLYADTYASPSSLDVEGRRE